MKEKEMKNIIVDDMFLTADIYTSAGSKMLEGYQSMIDAEAITKTLVNGYTLTAKAPVGEFAIDLLGETSANAPGIHNGILKNFTAQMLLSGDAEAALCFDVNGYPRRVAAQSQLICLKPTYGAVSRHGVVSVAPSGETVDVLSRCAEDCRDLFHVVAEHTNKNNTPIRRVAVLTSFEDYINQEVKQKINTAVSNLEKGRISITYIKNDIISASKVAWNVILCAELCKSTARYDGIRYGHRTEHFSTLDELYTNSRTEGFGDLTKAAILYGSEVLSAENYQNVYEKSLRVRRVIVEEFEKLFEQFDAVLLPACSLMEYTEEQVAADKYIAFDENRFTAPASLTGLPALVAGGVQLIGKAFFEDALLDIANILAGEGR